MSVPDTLLPDNVVPLNERGARYLLEVDLTWRMERIKALTAKFRERREAQAEIERHVFLFGERPAPTYSLTDFFKRKD